MGIEATGKTTAKQLFPDSFRHRTRAKKAKLACERIPDLCGNPIPEEIDNARKRNEGSSENFIDDCLPVLS
jgi:hypothetical protein